MKRLYFLINCKTPLNIMIIFLKNKFLNILTKKKKTFFKKNHSNFLQKKRITNDFFSSHAYNFWKILKDFKSKIYYLEIGSYEGNSVLFLLKNFPNSEVHCVDTWIKTEEYSKDINFSEIEKNFDYNTSEFKKLNKHKKTSDSFFEKNRINFDVIYIDGYHFGPQVYKDVTNAWKFLKVGGYLICDDYIWNIKSEIKLTPCYSINKFLNTINNNYKVEIVSNSQIFFKKIR